MATKLLVKDNYLIAEDTITGPKGEYALNHCVYREEQDAFVIKERIDTGSLAITKADVAAGKIEDEAGTPFTESTLRDFLRANTGFNPATGGSVAQNYTEVIFTDAEIRTLGGRTLIDTQPAGGVIKIVDLELHVNQQGLFYDPMINDFMLLGHGINIGLNFMNSPQNHILSFSPGGDLPGRTSDVTPDNLLFLRNTNGDSITIGTQNRVNPTGGGNAIWKWKIWWDFITLDA